MRWEETEASECRYGGVVEGIFGEGNVLWENSYSDYQGYANILVLMPDGRVGYYHWSYGSCSGCDSWEAEGLTDSQIAAEIRATTAWFSNVEEVDNFLRNVNNCRETHNAMARFEGGMALDEYELKELVEAWEQGLREEVTAILTEGWSGWGDFDEDEDDD